MEVRLGSCRIVIDFGFPAMMALLLLWGDAEYFLQTIGVCMIHELGHGIAMLAAGAGLQEIRLHAAGIRMKTRAVLLHPLQECAILLSGPTANLLAAAILYVMHGADLLCLSHLCMGLFNLLPYRILDGGSLLEHLSCRCPAVYGIRRIVCLLLSVSGCVLLWHFHIHNPFVYLMLCYLAVYEMAMPSKVDKPSGI